VKTEDSQIDHLILIEVKKDGDHLVVEVVGDLTTEIKEDRHQDHVEETMFGVMTMTINVEVIVDHVAAVEAVVAATISVVEVVDVAVEEEAVAEMVDHGAEIEIAVVVVVEALQVYHVFMILHHVAVVAHGEIDLHLEWNDANHRLHIQNLPHAVVEAVGAMHLLQQVAPVVVVDGVVVRPVENHHQAALAVGVVVAVVVKPHHENHLLIEVNHQVVVVVGDHLQNHLDQHHGDHQLKNPKKKKVKVVGEVQLLQLPVPNPQVVGNHQFTNSNLVT